MTTLPPRLQLLTTKEAADLLRISEKTLRRRIKSGAIGAVRDGRLTWIPLSEIERFIAERRTT